MKEIKPPRDFKEYLEHFPLSVFLAGSIEMGAAIDWQAEVSKGLEDQNVLVLNPRRDNWDASWEQSIDNPQFNEQVNWELDALDAADLIVMYFAPSTKSPITMLELGIHAAQNPDKLVVCCPDGFWRKGNVDIVCKKYGIEQVATVKDLIKTVILRHENKGKRACSFG